MSLTAITPELLSAALGLAKTTSSDFCVITGLNRPAISKFLNGRSTLTEHTAVKIIEFFNNRNIKIHSHGVEFYKDITPFYGRDGFQQLYDNIYASIKEGGHLFILNGVAESFQDVLGEEYLKAHVERMTDLSGQIDIRTIVRQSDTVFFGKDYAQYKWIPDHYFPQSTKIIYKTAVAFINMNDDNKSGKLHRSADVVEAETLNFEMIWNEVARDF